MIKDLAVYSSGDGFSTSIEYGTGDFYVRSMGAVDAQPDSAAATAASIAFGPVSVAHTKSRVGVYSTSAFAQSMGHGMSFARSYVSLM